MLGDRRAQSGERPAIDPTRPIEQLAEAVRSGELKAVDLVQSGLDRLKTSEDFHATLELNRQALKQAAAVDQKPIGRLAGIPFAAKDNFLTTNTHTTAASNILKPFLAPYVSTAIQKLQAEGAILIAKTNLDAFGHGASTENSDFGPTKNPLDQSRVPGGSSGGSAAAVALGQCSFAIGTDTGGSIRQPSSFCGVVGLKPTYGLVSRSGVIAMASSTDVIGPIGRRVEDVALVLDVMAGRDPLDATTIERDSSGYELRVPSSDKRNQEPEIRNLKVGVIKEYLAEGVDPEVRAAIESTLDQLRKAGAAVEEISLPSLEMALACYYILVPAEISSNLARYDGVKYGFSSAEAKTLAETYDLSRDQGFGAEAKRRILIGTYVLSSGYYDAYYKQAQKVRTLIIKEFDRALAEFDFLIGPVAPTPAFKLGEKNQDPLAMYLADVMTVAPSLVGVPAISLPAGLSSAGLPIGIQLIGRQKGDRSLLEAAAGLEGLIGASA